MADFAVGDVVQINYVTSFKAQEGILTTHWQVSAVAGLSPTALDVANQLFSTRGVLLRSCMSRQSKLNWVSVQHILPAPRLLAVTSNLAAAAGSGGLAPLPGQICGLFTKITPNAGPAFRGRGFVPWPSEADNDDVLAVPTAAYLTKIDNLAVSLTINFTVNIGGGNAVAFQPVLFHRATNTATIITGSITRTRWATLRRRGDRGRPNVLV